MPAVYSRNGIASVPAALLLQPENVITSPVSYNTKKSRSESIKRHSLLLSLNERKINYASLLWLVNRNKMIMEILTKGLN
jgi:hypothetical protein